MLDKKQSLTILNQVCTNVPYVNINSFAHRLTDAETLFRVLVETAGPDVKLVLDKHPDFMKKFAYAREALITYTTNLNDLRWALITIEEKLKLNRCVEDDGGVTYEDSAEAADGD